MRTAELNELDQLYLHLDRDDEPWSVHLEVRVDGALDEDALRAAVREAADRHPIARARLGAARGTDVRYRWEIADELVRVPLDVVLATADPALEAARSSLLSTSVPLDEAPPFRLTLARHPAGDSLILNLRHAAGDGISAARLMASVLRAYAGEPDPVPSIDPLAARDIGALAGASARERIARARALVAHLARSALPPARVAPDGGNPGLPGYGFELLALEPPELETVMGLRREGATVNDVLLAALAMAIKRWNEDHGSDVGRVALMMPVNLRPAEWRYEVVANFASYVTISLAGDDLRDVRSAVAAAHRRTRQIKEEGIAGLIVDLVAAPTLLPVAVKQRLQNLIPLTGNFVVDTAVLSNLGRLDAVPGGVREVWFSPPGRMPLGVSVGAATLGGRLFLALRYRRALFDPEGAAAFGRLYRDVLVPADREPQASPV
jgi:NRPS condensation-like uncharacterized protein